MFKFLFLTIFVASVAVAFEEGLQVLNYPEEDLLVQAGDLHPQTLIRFRRQLFGGRTSFPSGGFNQEVGYRHSVLNSPSKGSVWGSLSQSGVPTGGFGSPIHVSPITYRGGADFATSSGSGLGGAFSHTNKLGSTGTVNGNLNLLNNKNNNLNTFASHTQAFDSKLHPVASSTTLGAGYSRPSGLAMTATGTRTSGQPLSGTVAAAVPVYTSQSGNTKVMLTGQSQFAQGQKPNHQVGVSASATF